MKSIRYLSEHKKITFGAFLLLLTIIGMWRTGTLSYPYIMTERQIQLIMHCVQPKSQFIANQFGYVIEIPTEYCAIPHRIYPRDGTVHIIPKGWYFVFNEYAKGTVTENAVATLLFINDTNGEEISSNKNSLRMGGFLDTASTSKFTNSQGVSVVEYDNASGIIDGERFNWAFIVHPEARTSLTIQTRKTQDNPIYGKVIANIRTIPLEKPE